MVYYIRVFGISFLIGLIVPFAISIFAIMLSFDTGVAIAKVFIPLSSVSGAGDSIIQIGNGVIYGTVAVVGACLIRKIRNI